MVVGYRSAGATRYRGNVIRSFLIVAIASITAPSLAAAQAQPEQIGTVSASVEEESTDLGKLHLSAALLGYQLSGPTGGPVSTVSATFELSDRMFVTGRATTPLFGFVQGDAPPFRLEGGIQLFAKDKLVRETEKVDLERRGDQRIYVDMPLLNRNRAGLEALVMLQHGGAKVDTGGPATMTTTSTALIAVVGISGVGATGYTTRIEGYGKRSNYRFNNGGLDVLIDVTRSYGVEPTEKGTRFGGRLWAETLWFRHLGMSARFELGKYPAYSGWVLVASVGGSLHLL